MTRRQSYRASIWFYKLQTPSFFGRVRDSDKPLSEPVSLTFERRCDSPMDTNAQTGGAFSLIDGCGVRERALCLGLSSEQQYLSQGALPLSHRPQWLWLWADLPSLLTHGRQTRNYPLLACPLAHFLPCFHFPVSLATSGGMKPLTGRWADGDRQCSPGRKLIGRDQERIWRC